MTAKTLQPYSTIVLERRWFKDPSEFEFICKNLGIEAPDLSEVESIDMSVDQVDFEVEDGGEVADAS